MSDGRLLMLRTWQECVEAKFVFCLFCEVRNLRMCWIAASSGVCFGVIRTIDRCVRDGAVRTPGTANSVPHRRCCPALAGRHHARTDTGWIPQKFLAFGKPDLEGLGALTEEANQPLPSSVRVSRSSFLRNSNGSITSVAFLRVHPAFHVPRMKPSTRKVASPFLTSGNTWLSEANAVPFWHGYKVPLSG